MGFHSLLTLTDLHSPFRWVWANAAARLAETVTADDINKIGWQQDTNAIYALYDTTPTWSQIGGGGSPALNDLSDVTIVGVSNGDLLVYNSGTGDWENNTLGIANLDDVDLTGVSDGDVLVYNAGTWEVFSGALHVVEDAVTNDYTDAVTIGHNTTGTAAADFGTGIAIEAEDDTLANQPIGGLTFTWTDPSSGSTFSRFVLYTMADGVKTVRAVLEPPAVATNDGDARGIGAVDLQSYRNISDRVASGLYSAILSGENNQAQGDRAVVVSGNTNAVDEQYCVVLAGEGNIADGGFSSVINGSTVYANYGWVAGNSGVAFADSGDTQGVMQLVVSRTVTHSDTSWYQLYTDGDNTTTPVYISADTAITFNIQIIGSTQDNVDVWGYQINGVARCPGSSLAILASNVTTLYESDSNFNARVTASSDQLLVEVTDAGGSGDTVRWVARITWAQVGFPSP